MPNKVTLIYDRVTKNLQTFAGNPVPAPMQPGGAIEVFQGDRILLNLRVVETLSAGASQTAVDLTSPSSPTAMRLNVRAARSSTAAQYAFADTYNEGFEATNENLSTGRVTWSLSFDNAALDTALAAESNDYVVAHADVVELRTINSVQFPTTLFALTFKIYKQVDGGDVETHSGTAQAGGASTITLESGASTTDDIFNGFYILITGGTGAGQERAISDYVGSTLVATVSSAWNTQPDSSSTYRIRASRFSTTVLTDAEVVQRTPEVQTFSGNGTLAAANGISTVYCSGSPTLTLPSAASYSRMGYIIINTDGGTTTINRAGTDTINSAATSYSVVGDDPALIVRDTSSHWQARHTVSGISDPGGNGILARTALNTVSARTITGPAAGISVANGDGVSGNPTLSLANDLSALEALASTGIAVRSGSDTWVQRSIAGTSPVQVANGSGAAGNPTISVDDMVGDSGAGGTKGLVPAPASGDAAAGKFLKADATWAVPAGGGDVTGPGSSTDNAVARFDGTGGDTLQNSGVTIDDSNNVVGVVSQAMSGDLVLAERADHASTPGAGYGYLWVKNTTPSTLIFTDDAGDDTTLGSGGGGGTTTMFLPASAFTPRATNGPGVAVEEFATNDVNLEYLLFDGATEEYADALIQLPSTWDAGTITATHYWTAATGASAADTVEWETAARAYANDDAIDQAAGTAQVISDAVLAVGDMHITSASPAITIGGSPAVGQPIRITVSRNVSGTDDMTEDAKWFGVLLTWTTS